MKNNKTVEESLVDLISKIGEKITIRRSKFFNSKGKIIPTFIILRKKYWESFISC